MSPNLSLPSASSHDPKSKAPREARWHLVYYLLAAFDLVTVLIGLMLSHHLVTMYTRSVHVNKEWAERLDRYSTLGELAGDANAPGNDVFDSREVSREAARMQAALEKFNHHLNQAKTDIRTEIPDPERERLLTQVGKIERAMEAMTGEAGKIFAFFDAGSADMAGERMATMDRRYAVLNAELAGLSRMVRDIQSAHLTDQEAAARRVAGLEMLIAALIVMIIAGITVYGRKLSAEFKKASEEKARYQSELESITEAAQAANKAKSDFLANMSHEIRTPLNAVIGFSDLLKRTELNRYQLDYLNTIQESGEALLGVINDILDISKIESGQIKLESIDFDLQHLVESSLQIIKTRVSGKSVELGYDISEEVPSFFKGDPTRIRQMLLNLLGNAAKFTEQGEILVTVRPASGPGSPAGLGRHRIMISVRDTGIGIPADKQEAIFEAFSQADTSTTRRYGGTGLGLAISRRLAEAMSGSLTLVSEPGSGSDFRLTLELEEGRPITREDFVPLDVAELKGRRVVIVDDNSNARHILQKYCLEMGMEVVKSFDDSKTAAAWFEEQVGTVDLALLDIMMPDMDGLELAGKLKSLKHLNGTRLVAVTSNVIPGSALEAQDSGFDAFLTKPIIKNDLYRVIAAALGDRRTEPGPIVTRHTYDEVLLRGVRILVAEDNSVNQKLIRILLEKMGCVVEMASNGAEAIEKIQKGLYACCLMDMQMPVMGGIEAAVKIRKELGMTIPIIALTAGALTEDRERCIEAGMNAFLTKPIQIAKLKETLQMWAVSGRGKA